MADKDKMSIEEILAACRRADGGESSGDGESSATPQESAPRQESARSQESPTPQAPQKKPSEMTVEEMLAAARAEKAKPAGGSGATTPKSAAPKPADKPTPSKPSAVKAKPGATGKSGGPLDTASILAAARKEVKRGPVSKEEAAKAGKPVAAAAKPKVPPMPKKPDFAQPATKEEAESRRGFFGSLTGLVFGSAMAVGFVSLAVTQLLWVLGFARFMFPNILIEPPTKFKVGFPDVIGPGQVLTKFKAQFGVWIVRNEYEGSDQIYALRSVCTHLGCTPNWLEAEQKFKCPCHGSGFYKTGVNFEGPAPRPLERYAITVADDGQLQVDKSRKFQQELGQWSDPQSYVPI